jgi:LysM repeat protein
MIKNNPTYFPIHFLLHIFLVFISADALAQGNRRMTREEYVEMYKDMAIREMHTSKIPASIKLAQAILESGSGNSTLASDANNHFGIKCHGWRGESVRADDDAPQECFRKYDNPDQSFKDHSAFLTSRPRYAALFDLKITDYKGWARGLKKAGYATNPRYADLLIKIIEDLELYKYDRVGPDALAGETPAADEPANRNTEKTLVGIQAQRKIFTTNNRKYIIAKKNDDFYKIAQDFNIYSFQIWKYNELTRKDNLVAGERVYIEKKRRKAEVPFHTVSEGENMRSISQFYGIRLNRIYRLNRMKKDEQPRVGQVLWLQDRKPGE